MRKWTQTMAFNEQTNARTQTNTHVESFPIEFSITLTINRLGIKLNRYFLN